MIPTVSVIIPLYNKQRELPAAIRSILAQSFTDWEAVVVDDGSTDGSVEVLRQFSDPRIRLVSQANAGVAAARNHGIAEARAGLVAFLDADDEWMPDYLETMIALARKYPEAVIYGSNYQFRGPKGDLSPTILNRMPFDDGIGLLTNYFEVASCSHPPLWTSAVMARREALLRIGGFPVGVRSGEDLLTWARLAMLGPVAYDMQPHAIYNLGEGYDFSNLPPRRQDSGDPVGQELAQLLEQLPDTHGLRDYLSHWHKMRASVAIRYGERRETLREAISSLRWNPRNRKVLPFLLLPLLPTPLLRYIIRHRHH